MIETIWFLIWGFLWAMYFMLDGFDLGLGTLLPFLAGSDAEKKVVHNALLPYWDGNEVWLIAAGGVTFAAFPSTYAIMFSALYTPLMIILFALILRGVSLEFRGKRNSPAWHSFWDMCLATGSFIPALLLGVAFANIFMGIPIDAKGVLHGNLLTLLNPYGIMGGVLFVLMFLLHGAIWLINKSRDELRRRAIDFAIKIWYVLLVFLVLFIVATAFYTGLFNNYIKWPFLFVILLIVLIALLSVKLFLHKKLYWKAWFSSALTIFGVTYFGIAGIYPDLLPSSINSNFSLNIYNSSSSHLTLKIMLGVVLVFMPVVLAYQIGVYLFFNKKYASDDLDY